MKKGISLIALIITIIVLIILVSVVVLNAEGPMEEAIYAKFANDVSVIQESVTMKLLDNEARYAINQKAKLLRWVGIIDGYTEEMANEGIEPPFNNSTIVIKGNRVLKISSEMKKNLNITKVEFDNYYVDAKGKVYHSGLQIGENIYYTAEDKYISSDTITNNSEENTTIVSQDVQTYITQGYVPIYTAEQFLQIGSNVQNYEIRDLNDTVIKVDGFNMNSDANYILANNIDFTGYEVEPIAEFSGIFDGNGYTISNIVIDNSNSESDFIPIEFATSTDLVKHPAAIFEKLSDGAIVKQTYINTIAIKGDRTVAVIGGECTGSILIKDCYITNAALEVYESSAISGILAFAYNAGEDIIRVENCSVNDIEIVEQKNTDATYDNEALSGYGFPNSAGIVSVAKSNLEVVNCIVENSITASKELAAGIVYMQQGKSIYVENCIVEDTNLSGIGESAGIVAKVVNSNVEITECRSENIVINGQAKKGGIIAICENTNAETFKITNCIVRNIDFVTGDIMGAIVGTLQSNTTSIINYCIVENCEIESTNLRGGIVAYCLSPITMSNNNVTNLNMINGGCATGGLVGILRYNTEVISTFTNCNVDYITISAGEIVAGLVAQVEAPVTFTNCNASNLNLANGNSNGGIIGMVQYSSNISSIFTNCDVSDSSFNSENFCGSIIGLAISKVELANCDIINSGLNIGNNTGGVIGMIVNSTKIIDCTVKETEINGSCSVGGIIGCSKGQLELSGCEVSNNELIAGYNVGGLIGLVCNSAIIEENTVKYNKLNAGIEAGGVVGLASLESGNSLNVNLCFVNNINYNTSGCFGGIIGNFLTYVQNDVSITYCEVDTVIKDDIDQFDGGNFGGIVGYWEGSSNIVDIIDNCKVSNIFSSKHQMTGGVIGQINTGNFVISNCSINNFTLKNNAHDTGGIAGQVQHSTIEVLACALSSVDISTSDFGGGILGGFYYSNSAQITDCTVEDAKINGSFVGGIIGFTKSIIEFTNCDISNNELNASQYVGGLIGFNNIDAIINTCTVEDTELNAGINVGGLIGYNIAGTLDIDECSVKNINFDTGADFGGFIGFLYTGGNVSITNFEVDTITKSVVTEKNKKFGGIIGWCTSANLLIENGTVSNITSSNYEFAGGIAGKITGNIDINNCAVSNIILDTSDYSIGGMLGELRLGSLDVNTCTVQNVGLTNAGHHGGGIIGVDYKSNANIIGCTVTNLEIDATKCGGGIIGVIYETELNATPTTKVANLTIDQCILSGINIDAGECIAGLAGFLENNIATLSNCTLTSLTLVPGAIHIGNIVGVSTAVTLSNTNNIVN